MRLAFEQGGCGAKVRAPNSRRSSGDALALVNPAVRVCRRQRPALLPFQFSQLAALPRPCVSMPAFACKYVRVDGVVDWCIM